MAIEFFEGIPCCECGGIIKMMSGTFRESFGKNLPLIPPHIATPVCIGCGLLYMTSTAAKEIDEYNRQYADRMKKLEPISHIYGGLYQGGLSAFGQELSKFDAIVFCAKELQPKADEFTDKTKISCPIDDDHLNAGEKSLVAKTCYEVSGLMNKGKKVLVTCAHGLNRSGLVLALSILLNTEIDSSTIVDLVREKRYENALSNPFFISYIMGDDAVFNIAMAEYKHLTM